MQSITRTIQPPGASIPIPGSVKSATVVNTGTAAITVEGSSLAAGASVSIDSDGSMIVIECSATATVQILPGVRMLQRPYPESIDFLAWPDAQADVINAIANGVPTLSYYCDSASGNDANAGTLAAPVKTLVKLQALHDAWDGTGILGLYLIRGGVWNGNTTATGGTGATEAAPKNLVVGNKANAKAIVRDYGAAGSPPPRITTFNLIPHASFAKTATYTNIYEFSTANVVGWVRPAGSIGGTDVMVKIDGSGTLGTNLTAMDSIPGSWYYAGGKLYIHAFGSQDPTAVDGYEYTTGNNVEGIQLGDSAELVNPAWLRVENVVVEGYGCQSTYAADNSHTGYGIHGYVNGSAIVAVVRCTVVYNNRHNIGNTTATTGGVLLVESTNVGCCAGDGNGPVVSYANLGGQTCITRNSLITGGVLYRQSRKDMGGCGIYAHTSSGTYKIALLLGIRNRNLAGQCQVDAIIDTDTTMLPTFTTSADCVAFSIGHSFKMREPTAFDLTNPYGTGGWNARIFPVSKMMYINCSARVAMITGIGSTGMWLDGRSLGFGICYNCDFEIDAKVNPGPNTGYTANFKPSIYNDDQKAYLWGSRVHVENSNVAKFTIFNDYLNGTTAGAEVRSTILSCNPPYQSNGAHAVVAINNNTANLKGNAYFGLGERTDSVAGYSNDANLTELAHCPAPGKQEFDSPLIRALLDTDKPYGRRLEYDRDGRARSATLLTVGPWEASS